MQLHGEVDLEAATVKCSSRKRESSVTRKVTIRITEKIAMQNTVDMAAYSGASTQAAYLNKMRELNEGIWKDIHGLRSDLGSLGEAVRTWLRSQT